MKHLLWVIAQHWLKTWMRAVEQRTCSLLSSSYGAETPDCFSAVLLQLMLHIAALCPHTKPKQHALHTNKCSTVAIQHPIYFNVFPLNVDPGLMNPSH